MSFATNPYLGAANPYLQQNIDDASSDMIRNWNTSVQPAYNSAMVNSGSFGNAGVQQMNDNAALTQQKALGSLADNMRMQDYQNQQQMYQWDTGMDQSIYNNAVNQNNQNLQLGLSLLGQQNGYNTQNLANGTTIENTPYNYWSNFSNAANVLGGQGGQLTNTQGTSSSPLMSAFGGAQLFGPALSNYFNSGSTQQKAYTSGTATNTGTQYLTPGYDALGFPNGQ